MRLARDCTGGARIGLLSPEHPLAARSTAIEGRRETKMVAPQRIS